MSTVTSRFGALNSLVGPKIPISYRSPVGIGEIYQAAADKFGRVPLVVNTPLDIDPKQRHELDYVEAALLVENLSGALHSAGVRAWDRVAIVKRSSYDTLLIAAAAARIGAIPALISPNLNPLGKALQVLLARLDQPFLFTDEATLEKAGLASADLSHLTKGVIGPAQGGRPLGDLFGGVVPPADPRKGEEPMFITHTGGTTGVPKMAEQSVAGASHVANIEARRSPWSQSPSDTIASCITFVHGRSVYGALTTLTRGSKLLALTSPADGTLLRLFAQHKPTILESHPNQLMAWEHLCDHPDEPFANVRIYFNTFDAAHPRTISKLLEASRQRMPLYLQCYGMTEVGPVTVRAYTRSSIKRISQATDTSSRDLGWPVPFATAFRIVDPETKEPVPRGTTGMIQARTRARCLTFIAQPEKYWKRRHGPWFDTGDFGRATRSRTLQMLDRQVDRIEGVDSCLWLEDTLTTKVPSICEVVVIADAEGVPVPLVWTHGDEPLDHREWAAATRELPGLGAPQQLTSDQLPRTETFKARRFLLRDRLQGRRIEAPADVLLRDGA